MFRSLLFTGLYCLLVASSVRAQTVPQESLFPGVSGQALVDSLIATYTPDQTLGYGPARDSLYAWENKTYGSLRGVYSGFSIILDPLADPSTDAANKGINAEHSWPQSMGAADEPQRSDLQHLFPAKAEVNSARSNDPFGEIPDANADAWYRLTESQSTVPTTNIDEWSERDGTDPSGLYPGRFEPREDHKGNVARAMFYFYVIYRQAADAADPNFFGVQKDDLLRWMNWDPVDTNEITRDDYVASLQGNHNPFIRDTTLARRVFGDPVSTDPDPPTGLVASTAWINELHYDNTGTDVGEGVEIAGEAGTSLVGWTIELYNGSGGARYVTTPLSGTIPDQDSGFGTLWFDLSGLQNGSPDGIALIDSEGGVVQFLSYEGQMTAVDGSAQTLVSENLPVSEDSGTPVGYSLQVLGTGYAYDDFTWSGPMAATPGFPNAGQDFVPAPVAWINEIHYDNSGNDINEGIEIAGTAGLSLAGWSLVCYHGTTGLVYDTKALYGVLADAGSGFGFVWYAYDSLDEGSGDGVALVDPDGSVVTLISYEGSFVASDGPAAGMTSEDIGVSEGITGKNRSLQLVGSGSRYADFAWQGGVLQTRGAVNNGQVLTAAQSRVDAATSLGPAPPGPVTALAIESVYPNPASRTVTLRFTSAASRAATVSVYDVHGRLVANPQTAYPSEAGLNEMRLSVGSLPNGVYGVILRSGRETAYRQLVVLH